MPCEELEWPSQNTVQDRPDGDTMQTDSESPWLSARVSLFASRFWKWDPSRTVLWLQASHYESHTDDNSSFR